MNIRFKKYLLLILCLLVPVQLSYGDANAQVLLKKFKEKGIVVGKIGLGVGGVAVSSLAIIGIAFASVKEQNKAIRKGRITACCCGNICFGKCSKQLDEEYGIFGSLLVHSLIMIKRKQ